MLSNWTRKLGFSALTRENEVVAASFIQFPRSSSKDRNTPRKIWIFHQPLNLSVVCKLQSKILENFYIPRSEKTLLIIKKSCQLCRNLMSIPSVRRMGDLRSERCQKFKPFTHILLDCLVLFKPLIQSRRESLLRFQSAPNPVQSAANPARVNMSTPTGIADPNISWSYSTKKKNLYTMFPNTSTQSQGLFKDCLGFARQLFQSPGLWCKLDLKLGENSFIFQTGNPGNFPGKRKSCSNYRIYQRRRKPWSWEGDSYSW